MTLDLTRHKLDWLRGLKGIRERRLQECREKRQWSEMDLEMKERDIAMIDSMIDDYSRVEARYLEKENAA